MTEPRSAPPLSAISTFEIDATDRDFPMPLGQTHPPVVALFGRGCESLARALFQMPGIAIVGSRQATLQGCSDARWFGRELSRAGFTIISGLAQGIDAAAHRGGLEGPGKTVAVLGHGRDLVYPLQHRGLAEDIAAQGGCLLTEYPEGMPAKAHHFPHRNRIIAGLAKALLIVEALPQSGSLITARHALDLGVDVFVIPGSIHLPQSQGCNQLIRQGAQPVESPEQLLADLGLLRPPIQSTQRRQRRGPQREHPDGLPLFEQLSSASADARRAHDRLLFSLSHHPQDVDSLEKATGLPREKLYGELLLLELRQLASRTPDGRWRKIRLVL